MTIGRSLLGLTPEDCPIEKGIEISKPGWSLGSEGKEDFSRRLASILMPSGSTRPTNPTMYFGLKHYEWKQLGLSDISEYCLEGLLGDDQESSLFSAFDALRVGLGDNVHAH